MSELNRLKPSAPERIWLHTTGCAPEISSPDADWFLSVGLSNEYVRADLCEQQAKQIEALRGFAQAIMGYWPDQNEIPGDELQDIAETHGLLKPETRTEACGENCACDEYGDFPATCYRKTELLTGQ